MTAALEATDYIDFAPYDMPLAERRKLDVGDIYINQVRHTTCGWYIRSRNRHDMRRCKCGKLSIDGGSWYTKVSGDVENAEYHVVPYKFVEDNAAQFDSQPVAAPDLQLQQIVCTGARPRPEDKS